VNKALKLLSRNIEKAKDKASLMKVNFRSPKHVGSKIAVKSGNVSPAFEPIVKVTKHKSGITWLEKEIQNMS
jgi:hypothetical protein